MKTRNLLIFIIVVLFLTAGIYLYSKEEEAAPVVETPVEEQPALVIDKSLVEEKHGEGFIKSNEPVDLEITYPQFKNVSAEFNKEIEAVVENGIAGVRNDAVSTGDLDVDWEYSFYTNWTPVQVNEKYVSFILTVGGYTGGAHGYQNLLSFNYDVVNKKEISLADLFPNDPNYLKTVSDFSRTELRKKFGANNIEDMLLAGTEPTRENFNVFTFTDKEITLYFTQYQVAPYAMGESVVVISR